MMNKLYYSIVFHCVNIILQKYEIKFSTQNVLPNCFMIWKLKDHLNMFDSTDQQFIKILFPSLRNEISLGFSLQLCKKTSFFFKTPIQLRHWTRGQIHQKSSSAKAFSITMNLLLYSADNTTESWAFFLVVCRGKVFLNENIDPYNTQWKIFTGSSPNWGFNWKWGWLACICNWKG